jgi:hypothetical protein
MYVLHFIYIALAFGLATTHFLNDVFIGALMFIIIS